ncbi:MAG: hypothetical protein SPL13_00765 [Clostridia bacterium]|nr:hypothetical protein [Clostridia bacterium]
METKKKGGKTKFIILAIFLLVLIVTYAFDYIRCTTYKLEVTASDMKPVASSTEKVEILVRVTRFGKIQKGHKIFALQSNGSLDKNVAYTDDEGCIKLIYTPYNASSYTPAEKVEITIRDESNSIIWEVNAYTVLVLDLQNP